MALNLPGDLLIFLGFVFNILVGLFYFLVARGKHSYINLAKKSYHVFVSVVTLATAYLFYLFFSGAWQVKYVHGYADSSLSFFYTLSAFWGGQEGTYLLWLFMNACFGYFIMYRGGRYTTYAMVIFSTVNLFFLSLLLKLSPFALYDIIPPDGAGLNPLLQDPWMVIHPPVIFVGYSMAALPFAFAMAALIMNDYTDWVRRAFPWAAITALMLAGGNILGGYWAYKTLGWGGFWAWDPVENSSFIPWFVSLAFLHGLIIEKRTGAMRKSNILLASFVFLLVVYGTFLTRSGVLADFSVHSFVDLGINQYLVGFMVYFIVMTVVLFFIRAKSIGHEPLTYNLFHKEFVLFGGMVLLFLFSIIILFWTSLPILSGIFMDKPRAADLSSYNDFALPFANLFSLLLAMAPFAQYSNHTITGWQKKIGIYAVIGVLLGFGGLKFLLGSSTVTAVVFTLVFISYAFYFQKAELFKQLIPSLLGFIVTVIIAFLLDVRNYEYLLFFGMAAMVIISNIQATVKHLPGRWKTAGAQITHFGFGVMLIGVLASAAFTTNEKLVIPRGGTDSAYGLTVSYDGMEHHIEYPKNRLLLTFTDGGSNTHEAKPELYWSERMQGIFRKPYIKHELLYDLYFSPEQVQDLNPSQGVMLEKGTPYSHAGYSFIFHEYEMGSGQHGGNEGMTVTAQIDVIKGSDTTRVAPGIHVPSGGSVEDAVDIPVQFGENDQYSMTIKQIIADQGAVAIDIPGLKAEGPPDRLILDISKKPFINFVWIGTTLILLGSLIVFVRRREELVA